MFDRVYVFDIDGTLANIEHRVHYVRSKPKNWNAFFAAMPRDEPYLDIRHLLLTLDNTPNGKIILCTGREEIHHQVTVDWMNKWDIPFQGLYMRRSKDYRQDYSVKVELLKQIREEHGDPCLWFDDRDQVVTALRAHGVRVLQVREGSF